MHDGVWDRGDYIPLLFFKFTINFYEKISPRGKWIFQKYFKFYILIFGWPCIFLQNLLSFQMHHVVHIYTKIFYKLFFKFNITKFFMKNRPTWWDECPFKLIKIIYIYVWNLEIRIWTYDEPFWNTSRIYISLLN